MNKLKLTLIVAIVSLLALGIVATTNISPVNADGNHTFTNFDQHSYTNYCTGDPDTVGTDHHVDNFVGEDTPQVSEQYDN